MSTLNAAAQDDSAADYLEPYLARVDGVTVGAGNAKDANAVAQFVDPWPRYARDRRISVDGARLSGVIEHYRGVEKTTSDTVGAASPPGGGSNGLAGSLAPDKK